MLCDVSIKDAHEFDVDGKQLQIFGIALVISSIADAMAISIIPSSTIPVDVDRRVLVFLLVYTDVLP